jgi:hypothetical protein
VCKFGVAVAGVEAEALPPHSKVGVGHLKVAATTANPRAQPGMAVLLGGGVEEFGQAEDAGVVAVFALDVVYAGPGGLWFFGRRGDAGDGYFYFDAVV